VNSCVCNLILITKDEEMCKHSMMGGSTITMGGSYNMTKSIQGEKNSKKGLAVKTLIS